MAPRLPISRPVRAALLGGAALMLLAGCEAGQFGLSGRDAEWSRQGAFSVVSASAQRAVLSAAGNQVAVEPSPGFCLAEDGIETSARSAFVLIGDCTMDTAPAGDGALDLPPGMPGIITVSLSGDPGFSGSGGSDRDLSQLETYLETAEGRALLGRGGEGAQVSVIDTRRQGDILYVLVEDRDGDAVPMLAPRFWRAFVELNERLAVITVSGFRDVPMDEDEMLRHLGDQVRQLQVANAVPVEEAPVQYAEAQPRSRAAETGSGDEPPEAIELADAAAGEAAADDGTAANIQPETLPGETAPPPADTAWEALARFETAEGENTAHAAMMPDPAWAELANADATVPESLQPEGVMAFNEAEQGGDNWMELAQANGSAFAEAEAALDEDPVDTGPRTLIVASTATGTQGLWPMPAVRPGGAATQPSAAAARPAAGPAAAPAAAPRAAPSPRPSPDSAAGVPIPPTRLINPTDRVAQPPASAVATPMPLPRKRP